MLQVPDIIKDLYTRDTVRKNFRVHFPNAEYEDIVNDKIVSESLTFTESICSQDAFKMGLSEKSTISFQCQGVGNIKGKVIECFIEIDTTGYVVDGSMTSDDVPFPFYRITLGRYYVSSSSLGDRGIRTVDGYLDVNTAFKSARARRIQNLNPVEELKSNAGAVNSDQYKIGASEFVYINRAENMYFDEYLSYTTVSATGTTSQGVSVPANTVYDIDGHQVTAIAIEYNTYQFGFNDHNIYQADLATGLSAEGVAVFNHFLSQMSESYKTQNATILSNIQKGGTPVVTLVSDYEGAKVREMTTELTEQFCAFTFKTNSNKAEGSATATIHNGLRLPIYFRYTYKDGTVTRLKRISLNFSDPRVTKVQGFMNTGSVYVPVEQTWSYWKNEYTTQTLFYVPNFSSIDVEGMVSGYAELTCAFDRYDRFSNSVSEFYSYKESNADTFNVVNSTIKNNSAFVGEQITVSGISAYINGKSYPYIQGSSPYLVANNAFINYQYSGNYNDIVQRYYPRVDGFSYYPMRIETKGVPFVQCGDRVTFQLNGVTYNSIILRRTLKGIQHLTDTFEAFGDY